MMRLTEEDKEKLRKAGREDLIEINEINSSGYAGMLPGGQIVDRRKYPNAVPIQRNELMGISEPKPVINEDLSDEPYIYVPKFVVGFIWGFLLGVVLMALLDSVGN